MFKGKIEDKMLNMLRTMKEQGSSLKDELMTTIDQNMSQIPEGKQKEFLKGSLDSALNGTLNPDEFVNEIKKHV